MAEHFRFMDPVQQDDGTFDREYNAQEFTDYFKALVTTGIMKSSGNQLVVTANGSNMITKVDTGIAFLLGRYYENDSFKELTHDTETIGNSRIDRIVVRMDLSTEARYVKSFVKKGTPSANPVPPTLTQTPNLYEISLAQVKVVGGQTFISTNAVTDERGKDVICPWAGSNILPNFNADGLQELIDKVNNMHAVTDGISTIDTAGLFGNVAKNIDKIYETGMYFGSTTWGTQGTMPEGRPSQSFQLLNLIKYDFSERETTGRIRIMSGIQVMFIMSSSDSPEIYMRSMSGSTWFTPPEQPTHSPWWAWVRANPKPNLGYVSVSKRDNQVLSPNVETIMQWNTNPPYSGDQNMADIVVNTRLQVPAGVTAVKVSTAIDFDSASLSGKMCTVTIMKNGQYTDLQRNNKMCPTGATSVMVGIQSEILKVKHGDYFEVRAVNNSTVATNTPTSRGVYFSMEVIERA